LTLARGSRRSGRRRAGWRRGLILLRLLERELVAGARIEGAGIKIGEGLLLRELQQARLKTLWGCHALNRAGGRAAEKTRE
jgi:hypothetical protein